MSQRWYFFSLFLAVAGLAGMAVTAKYVDPRPAEVADIRPSMGGEMVSVQGEVTDFSRSDGHVFFQLDDGTGMIDVVQFSSPHDQLSGNVTVEGKVGVYRGELQVVAETVES